MKRLLILVTTVLVACAALFFASDRLQSSSGDSSSKVLNLYSWGDYIDPALLTKFQKETGYHVNLETFDSNESMFTKIQQGGNSYDLTIPSDYMIEKMKESHLLKPLDKKKLHGMQNLDPRFLNQSFDRHNKYSVPYFWGTLGIVYNDKYVKPGEIQHWNDLWKPQYKHSIMMYDSARDVLGMALASMGKSMNTTDPATLEAAKAKLNKLSPNVKAVVADEIKTYMAQNEAAIAVDYSGDAAEMLANNSHLHYLVPPEASNLWFDNLVMPKTAKHTAATYAFLNFMLKPQNAAQNAEYVGYATPNRAAKALLPKAVRNDTQFYPPESTLKHLQVYQNLSPQKIGLYNDLYLEFKMHNH